MSASSTSQSVSPAVAQEYKKALSCKLCDAKFGYIYPRKQQCGECSNAFCHSCSNQKISKIRHCKSCYNIKIEESLSSAISENGDLDETKLAAIETEDEDSTNQTPQNKSSKKEEKLTPAQEKFIKDQENLATLVVELRKKIEPLLTAELLSISSLARESSYDRTLIRFLTARKFNVDKAFEMWQSVVEWRTKNGVDDMLKPVYEKGIAARRCLNNQYDHKFGKAGHPIYIEILETLDLPKLMAEFEMDDMLRYIVHSTEFRRKYIMGMASILKGKQVDQIITILDIKNFGRKQMKKVALDFVKRLTAQSQANYPEVLHKMLFVNVPTLFYMVWKVISPWMDERTRSKIVISSGPATAELLELCDQDALPVALTGTCTCVNDNDTDNKHVGRHACMHTSVATEHYEALCKHGWDEFVKLYPIYAELDELNEAIGKPDVYNQLLAEKHARLANEINDMIYRRTPTKSETS